jgi:L-2,4-diaminobutyrate transaminase
MITPSLEQLDVQSVFHPATSIADLNERGPLIIDGGSGCHVRTHDGRQVLDAAGGLWCVNVGYGRDSLAKAAHDEMRNGGFYHSFSRASNRPQILLADRLLRLLADKADAPNMRRFFSGAPVQMPTTRWSSWFATTTTCAARGPNKRSFLAGTPITASPSARRA